MHSVKKKLAWLGWGVCRIDGVLAASLQNGDEQPIMHLFLNIMFIFGRCDHFRSSHPTLLVGGLGALEGLVALTFLTEKMPRVDRRITKSKRALRSALIDLMEERGFDAVSVNDLCARADLNRGTFYNHFRDKEDLLSTLEDEVMADLDCFQAQMQDLTVGELLGYRTRKKPLPLLVDLFDYLREQGDFLHAVLGPGGDASFGPRLRDAVCTNLVQSVLHERYRNDPTPFVGYYVAFYASAYLGVIQRWIETDMRESSEEMALVAMRLFFIKPGESIKL